MHFLFGPIIVKEEPYLSQEKEIQEALKQLKDADENIRSQAALALGWVGELEVINPLVNILLNDSSPKVRANAAMSLGQLSNADAIQPLISALSDEDTFVRGMVIYSLGLLKAKEALKPLIMVLETDPEKEARMAAADALSQVGDEEVIKHLIKAYVHDPESAVKEEAKDSLNRLGDQLKITDIDYQIQKELENKQQAQIKSAMDKRDQILNDMQQKEKEKQRQEIIELIHEELPKLLEYAIHNEVIPFAKICPRFNCDEFTLELAITKLIEDKAINVKVNGSDKSFTVLKPQAELSEDAQMKLKLIRKKFGIDW
jgi:HEAT repeat protein